MASLLAIMVTILLFKKRGRGGAGTSPGKRKVAVLYEMLFKTRLAYSPALFGKKTRPYRNSASGAQRFAGAAGFKLSTLLKFAGRGQCQKYGVRQPISPGTSGERR